MRVVGLNEGLLMTLLTASSEIGGVHLELLVDSFREVINPSVSQDVLKGILQRSPLNLNSSNDCHSVGCGIAPC